jgi:hypothetical protein
VFSSTLRRLAVGAALLALAACDAGTPDTVYQLVSVNQQPLPAPLPDPFTVAPDLEVFDGTLTLRGDGSLAGVYRIRCRSDLPPSTPCTVTDDRMEFDGSWSRAGGQVTIGGFPFHAAFSDPDLTVTMQIPASMGLFPVFVLGYRR